MNEKLKKFRQEEEFHKTYEIQKSVDGEVSSKTCIKAVYLDSDVKGQ